MCVCVHILMLSWCSLVAGKKGRARLYVSGCNWVELVLMGLYGMLRVISVWGLLWRPGFSGGWLGPPPSEPVLLRFCSFIPVLSRPLSHSGSHSNSLLLPLSVVRARVIVWHWKSEEMFVFPPSLLPSQSYDLTGPLVHRALTPRC